MAAASSAPILRTGKYKGLSLDQVLETNPKAVNFMANNPNVRAAAYLAPWFDRWESEGRPRKLGGGGSCSKPPAKVAKPASSKLEGEVKKKAGQKYILPEGIHKGMPLDLVEDLFPDYIRWVTARSKDAKWPELKPWFDAWKLAHPPKPKTGGRKGRNLGRRASTSSGTIATSVKVPPPALIYPGGGPAVFVDGKYQGLSYDDVLRRHPRYIFKLLNRGGPKVAREQAWFEANKERIQKLRLKFDSSQGELDAANHLQALGIEYSYEYIIASLPYKRFDFFFAIPAPKGKKGCDRFLLEIDGIQHFQRSKYFHKSERAFAKYQATDRLKMKAGLAEGYKIIRIDYSCVTAGTLAYHLDKAIALRASHYFSTPSLYKYLD